MKNLVHVHADEVLGAWRRLEGIGPPESLRTDILNSTFPHATEWFVADIEQSDLDLMYMIPVDDFGILSNHTWELRSAADYFSETFFAGNYDQSHPDHAKRLGRLLEWKDRDCSRLIIVSDSVAGPFTILDGNHRAVLRAHAHNLIGATVYLGLHSQIRAFSWARHSFERRAMQAAVSDDASDA
jgi:hypothetical protein